MKPIHIILAEDDAIAAFITQEDLRNGPIGENIEEHQIYLEKG